MDLGWMKRRKTPKQSNGIEEQNKTEQNNLPDDDDAARVCTHKIYREKSRFCCMPIYVSRTTIGPPAKRQCFSGRPILARFRMLTGNKGAAQSAHPNSHKFDQQCVDNTTTLLAAFTFSKCCLFFVVALIRLTRFMH